MIKLVYAYTASLASEGSRVASGYKLDQLEKEKKRRKKKERKKLPEVLLKERVIPGAFLSRKRDRPYFHLNYYCIYLTRDNSIPDATL